MLANLPACGMVLVNLNKNTPGFEHAGIHWGRNIKTIGINMQPVAPNALDEGAQEAFFHHGTTVVRVAERLMRIEVESGNRWPSPKKREARAESDRSVNARLLDPNDPASGVSR